MIVPDEDTYRRDALSFTVIPVAREIRADFETPLSLFLKCGGQFLLESIERGENVGRYSFIARGTKTRITLIGREIAIEDDPGRPPRRMTSNANPLDEVRDFMNGLRSPTYEGLPPFFGGTIGYLGYEAIRYFENVPIFADADGLPDGVLVIPEMLLVYDSVKRSLFLIAITFPSSDPGREYARALARIEEIVGLLQRPLDLPSARPSGPLPRLMPETPKDVFLAGVETCKKHIRDGDIIQAVISQRFSVETDVSPFSIYQIGRAHV